MDRDMDAAGQMNRQVGDDPFVAVLGNLNHSIAGLTRRAASSAWAQPQTSAAISRHVRVTYCPFRRVQGDAIARLRHAACKEFDESARSPDGFTAVSTFDCRANSGMSFRPRDYSTHA